jgi:YaaC-like Protein
MRLAKPREGESLGFRVYPDSSVEATLGNPETVIWSSINLLCSRSAAESVAWSVYRIARKRDRAALARNVKLYVQHASEFYHAAGSAKPNTAPLIYYYSFLNLAKALCELRRPRFHERQECYAHGLSWRPDPLKLVDLPRERVTITGPGVWHELWESVMRVPCPAARRTKLRIKSLFSCCPEISAEFLQVFGGPVGQIDFESPDVLYDRARREVWLRFSVRRGYLSAFRLSARALIAQIQTARSSYVEVRSKSKELRTFQTATAKGLGRGETPWSALQMDILGLNVFTHLWRDGKLQYSFSPQSFFPLRMPQLVVSYTILFWLGSLVRYDPHSVSALMDSPHWILIDGFMSQSRVWLLELFEWAFWQTETTLSTSR